MLRTSIEVLKELPIPHSPYVAPTLRHHQKRYFNPEIAAFLIPRYHRNYFTTLFEPSGAPNIAHVYNITQTE